MPPFQSSPDFSVPAGATDCHMHVFGPLDRYPGAVSRSYTPREASLDDYRKIARPLGLQRVVFVQASAYGSDNRCLVDTLKECGPSGRGIAVIDSETGDEELTELASAGVRGVRVNAETFGVRSPIEVGRLLEETVTRIQPLGWHVQLFAALSTVAELTSMLSDLPVPVVVDHMGMANGELGVKQPGFDRLLDFVAGGGWAKVSGAYRVSSREPDFPDAGPIARALIEAGPDRIVWGSDWPHTGKHANSKLKEPPTIDYRPLDDGHLLNLLNEWVVDEPLLERILVGNPAALYDFPLSSGPT